MQTTLKQTFIGFILLTSILFGSFSTFSAENSKNFRRREMFGRVDGRNHIHANADD